MKLNDFLAESWSRYIKLAPDAEKIHKLLESLGETIVNDHVAFRTFNIPGMDRLTLGRIFEGWGYQPIEDLDFPEKKLKATYYVHRQPDRPKFFISELLLEKFSPEIQAWLKEVTSPALKRDRNGAEFFLSPSWNPIRWEDYEQFYLESEYAAWTAAFGIQVNHFTVFTNALKTFKSLQELNQFLIDNLFELNSSGGVIKGNPKELLEQSSTMAKRIPWTFSNGVKKDVMGCYYEFARRYLSPVTHQLFQGFIPKSADKIFESTYEQKSYPGRGPATSR